ncbi:MAG TPA: AraC family transcriptional regulator [Planctomycetota bacterium]|nr:AraC family transcriptional regulator [Planctomycetota bacterium]
MGDADLNTPEDDRPVNRSRYEVPTHAHKEVGLWVHGAGYHRAQPPHPNWTRVLGHYAAVYVSRGDGWFSSAPSGRVAVRPGILFWLFPPVEHSYTPTPGTTWTEQWVIFNGTMAEQFERQGYLTPSKPYVDVGDDPEIPRLFSRLEEIFHESGPLAVPMASAITHELIVRVHGIETGLLDMSKERGDPVIAQALKMIERESSRGLEPEQIASRLHVGYSTLRRRFRQVTGYSVKEYILRVQLKKAKELLAFTDQTVEEIAGVAGFADPYYFSRLFKEREGIPPTAFREAQTRE